MKSAHKDGYRELYELDGGTRREDGGNSVFTRAISLISWSAQQYRSNPDRPAIFVFISSGAQKSKALPSQGGFRSRGRHWIENRPAWPHKPSLDDVDWVNGPPRHNVSVPLVFKVVDTNGRPMPGVSIAFEIERYRTLQEMRSSNNDYNSKTRTKVNRGLITTGNNGYAYTTANGFRLKSIYRVFVKGTRWGEGPHPIGSTIGDSYARDFVNRQGDLIFRCDNENPILLVMMRKDERGSHAMPSRGGYERRNNADSWKRVEPTWPDINPQPIK